MGDETEASMFFSKVRPVKTRDLQNLQIRA